MNQHWLTLTLLFPLLGIVAQIFLHGKKNAAQSWIALTASLIASVSALTLVFLMTGASAEPQWLESVSWISSYSVTYELSLDGLNAIPFALIAIVFPILIASEWKQKQGAGGMYSLLLILQCTLMGTVCAQDLLLQFFFWALSGVPLFFLVGIWGGPQREAASFRLMVASSIGNGLLFAALVMIYYAVDPHTFALRELVAGKLVGKTILIFGTDIAVTKIAFILAGLGLALRAPIWPFHGWFTQVAEEAPPAVFVALAGVVVPVAVYLFIRLSYTLLPDALIAYSQTIMVIGAINLLMGGFTAIAQRSLRNLLAYVALSELGFILIGVGSLSSSGIVGAIYQLLVLSLSIMGFGLFCGLLVDRAGHADFIGKDGERRFGGLATKTPQIAIVAAVMVAALLGVPGLGGFIGHALLVMGGFSIHPGAVLIAGVALLLGTYYLFTMYRWIFLGKGGDSAGEMTDLNVRERLYLIPIALILFGVGIYPHGILELVRPTVLTLLSTVK